MQPLFKKLNLKEKTDILVLNAPTSFEHTLKELTDCTVYRDTLNLSNISFSLAFIYMQNELELIVKDIIAKAEGDVVLWFAYPKGKSKKYTSDINRDNGWNLLGELGFEGVRQVAIDDDWSALRFRRVEFIKSMVRDPNRLLSAQATKPK